MRKMILTILAVFGVAGGAFGQYLQTPRGMSGDHAFTVNSNVDALNPCEFIWTNKCGEPVSLGIVAVSFPDGNTNTLTVSRIRTDYIPLYQGNVVTTNILSTNSGSLFSTNGYITVVETNFSWVVTNHTTYVTTNHLIVLTTTNKKSVVVNNDKVVLDGLQDSSQAMAKLFFRDYDVVRINLSDTNGPRHVDFTAVRF